MNVATLDPRPFRVHTAPLSSVGYQLAALAELDDYPAMTERLAELYCRHYTTAHPHNPPGPTLWERRVEAFMGDDLVPAAQFIALHQGEPVAALGLRAGASHVVHDLIFAVDSAHHDTGCELLLALLGSAITWAGQSGVVQLVVELDSLDLMAVALHNVLPRHDEPAWLTLVAPAEATFPDVST